MWFCLNPGEVLLRGPGDVCRSRATGFADVSTERASTHHRPRALDRKKRKKKGEAKTGENQLDSCLACSELTLTQFLSSRSYAGYLDICHGMASFPRPDRLNGITFPANLVEYVHTFSAYDCVGLTNIKRNLEQPLEQLCALKKGQTPIVLI